ncbi:MAG: hypothetical protein U5L75_03010 [Candidatus Campbellbacteria bacterium]|nr:hypothetical protein [Candidatus Campbellbacteria bacterium]
MNFNLTRFEFFSLFAVLAVVLLGILAMGSLSNTSSHSPHRGTSYNNAGELDQERIEDIKAITRAVESFSQEHQRLPNSLNELKNNSISFEGSIVDPETKEPYQYSQYKDGYFNICANFATEYQNNNRNQAHALESADTANDSKGNTHMNDKWYYEPGVWCFGKEVKTILGIN